MGLSRRLIHRSLKSEVKSWSSGVSEGGTRPQDLVRPELQGSLAEDPLPVSQLIHDGKVVVALEPPYLDWDALPTPPFPQEFALAVIFA